ncbi:MAG: hypothetical protein AB7N76_35970 [Planctomycetota bacterium]
MRRTSILTAVALLLGLASTSLANEPYVRFKSANARDAALQTAVGTFANKDSQVEITLYGVVHIADKTYYDAVQRDLDGFDVVLYEGVAPGKEQPTAADKSLGEMQKLMGEMLGLTFQKDGIDYTRKNLVHADMNMDQLKQAMGGATINPLGQMMSKEQMEQMLPMLKTFSQFGKALMQTNPAMRDNFKKMMAGQLGNAKMDAALGEKAMQAILIERNKVVMEKLAEQLQKTKKGRIAIFYGAAHNPDFEQRLAKLGWTLQSKRWMSAWTIGKGLGDDETPAPAAPAQPESPKTKPESGSRWF